MGKSDLACACSFAGDGPATFSFSCPHRKREYRLLTWNGFQSLRQRCLVVARHGAQCLISHADENNCDERQDKRGGGADMPLAEDDAKIFRVPGEEHLKLHVLSLLNKE